jgi:hypothetical protein
VLTVILNFYIYLNIYGSDWFQDDSIPRYKYDIQLWLSDELSYICILSLYSLNTGVVVVVW